MLSSIEAALIYIPVNMYKVSIFSIPLLILVTSLFNNNHLNRCEVISHSGFDFYLLDEHFHALTYLLLKKVYSGHLPIF